LLTERLRGFDHARHAGHAADEHEFVDLRGVDAGVLQGRP
jgi:hypothetical protein